MVDSSRQGHPNDQEVAYPLVFGLSHAKAFTYSDHKMAGVLMLDVVLNKYIMFPRCGFEPLGLILSRQAYLGHQYKSPMNPKA